MAKSAKIQKTPMKVITPTATPNQRATNPDGGTKTISHASHFRGARMTNASGRLRRGSLMALVLPQTGQRTLLGGAKNTVIGFSSDIFLPERPIINPTGPALYQLRAPSLKRKGCPPPLPVALA